MDRSKTPKMVMHETFKINQDAVYDPSEASDSNIPEGQRSVLKNLVSGLSDDKELKRK
jgi:hypothetical protein